MLTQARIHELFEYDKDTGVFTRKTTRRAGTKAGTINGRGYRQVGVNGKLYLLHRLIWIYVNGDAPFEEIDHINGVRDDNRITNLRTATRSSNMQNQRAARSNSKSGVLGVHWHKARKKWAAYIGVSGKTINLGRFTDKLDAHKAYVTAKRRLHEGNTL